MKKRFRTIEIDGDEYSWSVRNILDGDGSDFVKIWDKNKNLIFDDQFEYGDDEERIITPSKIRDLILSINND